MSVVAVILAAGFSTRLGTSKQDIVFEGETLVERAERLARAVADEVIVVTPALNPDAAEGIASSIRAGVRLAGDNARVLIMLCDQPLITIEHLRELLAIDAPIVATGYADIAAELLALRGDRGARAVIEAHRHVTRVVAFEDAAVDIDNADDLRKLKG